MMTIPTAPQNKGLIGRIGASIKYLIYGQAGGMSSPWSWGGGSDYRYGTSIDYRARAGELTENAIVMACARWIMINFARPMRVMRSIEGAKDEEVGGHRLTKLLYNPNPWYSGELLMRSTALSLSLANNAYWLVWTNSAGVPVELWYEPHHTIRAVYPSNTEDPDAPFILYYEIFRNGKWLRVEVENVVHFRDSLDPRNPRMGLFVLGAALREIYTDNEAAAYTATILQNMGVTNMVVTPPAGARINDVQGLKRAIMAATQGDRRGEPIVLSEAAAIQNPAFNPEQMAIKSARDIPEERIAALLGPGLIIAAGLGAGLERSTFHNVGEAVASAFRNNIMPTHRIVAGQINTQLLPRMGNPTGEYLEFDLTEVPELQEDRDKAASRMTEAIKVGTPIYANEMRDVLGLPPLDDAENKFIVPPPYILNLPLAAEEMAPPAIQDVTAQAQPPAKALHAGDGLHGTKLLVSGNGHNGHSEEGA